MAYQRSYVIPTEELTLTDIKQARADATAAGIKRAMALKIATSEDGLLVRECDNVIDFGCGVGGWLTMPLLVAGNLYSVFATAVPAALTPVLAVNRIAVFYKVGIETAPTPVDQLNFREGVAAGTTYAVFDLEGLATKLVPDGYFTYFPVYDPQRTLNVVVRCRIVLGVGVQARVRLGCFIIEPTGPVIS